MKRLKTRIIAVVLTLVFAIGVMTGCAGNKEEKVPVIGISWMEDISEGEYSEDLQAYINGVEQAGGKAVALDLVTTEKEAKKVLKELDGIVFTGGEDIDPSCYGEEVLPECGEINEERDVSDMLLAKAAIEMNKAVLGICRGQQLINVAEGGSLYQDIPSQIGTDVEHVDPAEEDFVWHTVTVDKDSLLYNAMQTTELEGNSWHHQCVKELGKGFVAKAYTEDGVIESIQMEGKKFVLGVQFHPEWHIDPYYGDEEYIAIFEALVNAAR